MTNAIELDTLRSWIGKQQRSSEILTNALATRFAATLAGHTPTRDTLCNPPPPGIHWCLAHTAEPASALGPDGHPAKGNFLPPVPLPRRMWAASDIEFHCAPRIGATLHRASTIKDVVLKHSRDAEPLIFVTVEHLFTQTTGQRDANDIQGGAAATGENLLTDHQTIVFRQPSAYRRPAPATLSAAAHSTTVVPDSTLLFRYSALTFNGHRIHYDQAYATQAEGYPGLVVQGPLMATLLMNLAQSWRPEHTLRRFSFRALAAAFVDQPLQLCVQQTSPQRDAADVLAITNSEGAAIMTAKAHFGEADAI